MFSVVPLTTVVGRSGSEALLTAILLGWWRA